MSFGAEVLNADPDDGICLGWLLRGLGLWYSMIILTMGFARDGCCEVWGCIFNADPDNGICLQWLLQGLGLWYLMLILRMGFARDGCCKFWGCGI